MLVFEDVLKQYEPMIAASIRKLQIYRDHESYRQAGRIALWQAWKRFDKEKGNFTPYAYRSIQGAMLDELKKEGRFEEQVTQMDDELLEVVCTMKSPIESEWSDDLVDALELLSPSERELIQWLFIDGLTLAECTARSRITLAGIKKRRERMLLKLRKALV